MAQIVKELVTRWTYKVDSRQVRSAIKQVQGLKKNITEVKKHTSNFARTEISKVNRIRKAWGGLNKTIRNYRSEKTRASTAGAGGFKTFAGARALGLGAGPAAGLAAGAGIAALTGAGAAIKAGAGAEVAQVEYEGFLKSGEKARQLLKELADFGSRTPFEIPQLEGLGVQLLAGGFAANELIPTLSRLGDVTGGSSDKLNRMLINLIQIRNNNRAYTQDLKQFAMAGIPIFTQLQKQLGKSGEEIRKMAQDGEISFDIINKALIDMTSNGGMFEGRMKKISKTFLGRLSNMKDAFFQLGRTVSANVLPFLSDAIHSISLSVKGIADGVKYISQFGTAWKVFGLIITPILLKMFAAQAGILLLFLAVEDFIAWMQGRDSVIGRIARFIGMLFDYVFDTIHEKFEKFKEENKGILAFFSAMGSLGSIAGAAITGDIGQGREGFENLLQAGDVIFNQTNNVGMRDGETAAGAAAMLGKASDDATRSVKRRLQTQMGN